MEKVGGGGAEEKVGGERCSEKRSKVLEVS